MRVLIASNFHPTHFYQVVPYAQALQNAGHEVCVAAPPGGESDIIAAGLTVVTAGEPVPMSLQNLKEIGALPSQETRQRFIDAFGLNAEESDHWDVFYQYFAFNARFFAQADREDTNGLIDFARRWKPDLVLWESWFNVGGIMARVCGAPHARILLGPDYGAWSVELFRERGNDAVAQVGENPLVEAVRPLAQRYGLEIDDDLLLGQRTIDPLPTEIRLSKDIAAIPVRGIPYHGGSVKPEWLFDEPEKPRVAVTLGLSNRLWQNGDPRVPVIMEAIDGLDVEVIATLTDTQLRTTPRVPDNVRVLEYVPLAQLLPTCSAIIYHGAGGTFRAAQAAGIPQMIMDTDEPHRMIFSGEGENTTVTNADRHGDSWFCSKHIVERGAGVRTNHQTQSVAEIREQIIKLLNDPSYKEGAARLKKEWLAKPSPAEIIPELTKLTSVR